MASTFITPINDNRFTWLCLRDSGGGKCVPITTLILSFLGVETLAIGQAIYYRHSDVVLVGSCLFAGLVFLICGALFYSVVHKSPAIPFTAASKV